ncbi:MAG: iron ABC transporter permease [Thermotogae bacterium]|nr:iron ABC transporter permease [Thermotogota bacterium]
MKNRKRRLLSFVLIVLLLLITAMVSSFFGTVRYSLREFLDIVFGKAIGVKAEILMKLRIPRVLGGMIVGGSLAMLGAALQSSLRNPLADPYILGISAGAAFGAALSAVLQEVKAVKIGLTPLLAFFFALLASFLTYAFARRGGRTPVTSLILSGVVISFLFNAATTILVIQGWRNIIHVYAWIFGSLSGFTWKDVGVILPFTLGFGFLLTSMGVKLNVVSLGDEEAIHVGVDPEKLRFVVFALSSFMTAVMVSAAGVIGFVGLIVPHIARLIFGPDNRTLLPTSMILGGTFLVICDTIARSVFQPTELPLSSVTAIVGVPVFVYIMRRKGRE